MRQVLGISWGCFDRSNITHMYDNVAVFAVTPVLQFGEISRGLPLYVLAGNVVQESLAGM